VRVGVALGLRSKVGATFNRVETLNGGEYFFLDYVGFQKLHENSFILKFNR
jgi:hypothetical protein